MTVNGDDEYQIGKYDRQRDDDDDGKFDDTVGVDLHFGAVESPAVTVI